MHTRAEPLRAGLAILTVLGLVVALIMVFSGAPALAGHDADPETCDDLHFPEENKEGAGVGEISNGWGSATWDDSNDTTLDLNINEGWTVEICVKAGQSLHTGTFDSDDEVFGPFANGISHASWRNASQTTTTTTTEATTTTTEATTTTSETTTTTSEATTTTSEAEATTTTSEATTTTTEATTTTSSIPDEVLGTVITTDPTTIPDEVAGTTVEAEELPFTGIDSDRLLAFGVFLLASGLVALGAAGRKEEEA